MPPLIRTHGVWVIDAELPFEYWRFQSAVEVGDLASLRMYFNATPPGYFSDILFHRGNDDWTLLGRALDRGHIDIVRFLVEEVEADLDAELEDTYGDDDEWEMLNPILIAAGDDHLELVKYLIDKRPYLVYVKDSERATLLHWAAKGGSLAVSQFLVEEMGAQIWAMARGGSPLHWASFAGKFYVAKYLMEKGADPSLGDENGKTPFLQAIFSGAVGIARMMYQANPRIVEMADNEGNYPVHAACVRGSLGAFKFLVEECGCDFDRKSIGDWTPLTTLLRRTRGKHVNMALFDYILNKGPDLRVRVTSEKKPLLILAFEFGNKEVFCKLENRDPELRTVKSGKGQNLAEYALELCNKRAMELRRANNDSFNDDL